MAMVQVAPLLSERCVVCNYRC